MSATPLALFEQFPALRRALPRVELATLPTPVRRLEALGAALGAAPRNASGNASDPGVGVRSDPGSTAGSAGSGATLWLKDDGPISPHYGGNKVRKLEFLLAAARAANASAVLTFGYAGSNHATATAVHARRLGLDSVSILLPQRNAPYVAKNLLVSAAVGAELHEYPSRSTLYAGTALTMLRRRLRDGTLPYVIAPGGSSPLGTVGFVSAAFELAAQAAAGELPMPDRIYAAGGSLGTVVGLGIGLSALGARTKVVAVRVVDAQFVNTARAGALWRKTVALLRAADPSFPYVGDAKERIELRSEWYGGVYAGATPAAAEAKTLAHEWESLSLDVTYTAKTLACLISDARSGTLRGCHLLFWNTCNGSDLSGPAARATPDDLPPRLRAYLDPAYRSV